MSKELRLSIVIGILILLLTFQAHGAKIKERFDLIALANIHLRLMMPVVSNFIGINVHVD